MCGRDTKYGEGLSKKRNNRMQWISGTIDAENCINSCITATGVSHLLWLRVQCPGKLLSPSLSWEPVQKFSWLISCCGFETDFLS